MKPLLIFSFLLLVLIMAQSPCLAQSGSDLSVLGFSWSRYIPALNAEPKWGGGELPTRQQQIYDREKLMVEKNYGDLIRSKELRKVEGDAARSAIKPSDIFTYKLKVHNTGTKIVKSLYWEYQVIEAASPENLARREFFCATRIKANDRKDLEVFSGAPPMTKVISTKTLSSNSTKPFEEKAIINRIEYMDGSSWQRSDWSFPNEEAATLATAKRDNREPVCRGL